MPWIDNQYIFPRAAAANGAWPWPTPAETPPPAPPPINPLLRVKPLLGQSGDGGDPDDPNDPNYTAPTAPGSFGLLSGGGTTYSGETTTPTFFEGVGETARGIGKAAGVAGLLGGGPIAWGVEGLAGLSEMGSLNKALATYAQNAGIQNVPQIGLWDAIVAGLNPFEDLRDVATNYLFDPNELGDVWFSEPEWDASPTWYGPGGTGGRDITEANPEDYRSMWAPFGYPPGPGFYDDAYLIDRMIHLGWIEDFDTREETRPLETYWSRFPNRTQPEIQKAWAAQQAADDRLLNFQSAIATTSSSDGDGGGDADGWGAGFGGGFGME